MRYVFLDIDGVLNNFAPSKTYSTDSTVFDVLAVDAIEYLLQESQARVIVHSSWRKLPEAPEPPWVFPPPSTWWAWSLEWFKELCRFQGAVTLASRLRGVAPYTFSSTRGHDINSWIAQNHEDGDSYVVLDDQVSTIVAAVGQRDDVLIIETDSDVGLTHEQANEAIVWWKKHE